MSVALRSLWLNDALDLSDRIPLSYLGDSYQVVETLSGGVEHDYASGRSRAYTSPGDVTTATVGLQKATAEVLAWLSGHRGRVVCVRDWAGRKFFAVYHTVSAEVSTGPTGWESTYDAAQIEFQSVTWSEAVA